jgi:hypothetical protein
VNASNVESAFVNALTSSSAIPCHLGAHKTPQVSIVSPHLNCSEAKNGNVIERSEVLLDHLSTNQADVAQTLTSSSYDMPHHFL